MLRCNKCQGSMIHESMIGMDRWTMGELHQLRCLNCGKVVDLVNGTTWTQYKPSAEKEHNHA